VIEVGFGTAERGPRLLVRVETMEAMDASLLR
jgi:hypothetical protein